MRLLQSATRPVARAATWLAALLALLAAAQGCGVGYILEQGTGQLAMLSRREPIARVLQQPDVPAQLRDRLVLVWYARNYAERVVGLRASESFRDVVRLDRDAASYVVAAAPPDSLEPHRWCFPIAGCLPYIGYFNRAEAERERRALAARGYDVHLRGVTAYSMGGWLPDPVYSPLLARSRAEVANTVIHELAHGTVFVPGNAAFNEGFATFVGDEGALGFLAERYGPHAPAVAEARAELEDQRLYGALLHELTEQLRALYASDLTRAEKLRRREVLFARARARVRQLPFHTTRYERVLARPFNNALLATHAIYHGAERPFERAYERLGRDLRRLVAFVRDVAAHQPDPVAFLERWAARPRVDTTGSAMAR